MNPAPAHLPLAGITILDLTRLLPGPVATLHLANMGATVIKIEDKGIGDYARTMNLVPRATNAATLVTHPNDASHKPTPANQISQFFIAVNQGKENLKLDLKNADDKATFLKLVQSADGVIESFRPGVMDKLGLGFDELKKINPRLVFCALSGYGATGPFAHLAGHDINYLGYAGVSQQITDTNGKPSVANLQIADLMGGALTAAMGMLAALLGAQRTGVGSFVDVSMTDSSFAHNIMALCAVNNTGRVSNAGEDLLNGGVPCYQFYATADGRYMAVGALELKFWQALCEVIGKPEWKTQHWSLGEKDSEEPAQKIGSVEAKKMITELTSIFASRSQAAWIELFEKADCCVTPVLNMQEALVHPHFKARKMARLVEDAQEGEHWQLSLPLQFRS